MPADAVAGAPQPLDAYWGGLAKRGQKTFAVGESGPGNLLSRRGDMVKSDLCAG